MVKYIETRKDDNKEGRLQIEVCRWEVQGLHHTHQFSFVHKAHTSSNFIIHENWVEHWLNGEKLGEFQWGHGQDEAIKSSQTWKEGIRKGDYSVDLVSYHVFLNDLPCCGGVFVLDHEIVDYFTLQKGKCSKCKRKWEIGDGHHFIVPLKIDDRGQVVQDLD